MGKNFPIAQFNFTSMKKKHRGNIVEYAIKTSRLSHQEVADLLGRDRRSLSNYYKKEDLSIDIILKIGQIIEHDFSIELPELFQNMVGENKVTYGKTNTTFKEIDDVKESAADWKNRYVELLERHNRTLAELNTLLMIDKKKTSQKRPNEEK